MILPGLRVRAGDSFRLGLASSVAGLINARVQLVYDDGTDDEISIPDVTALTDRTVLTADSQSSAKKPGTIVGAYVTVGNVAVKRGQTYAALSIKQRYPLCRGYVYDGFTLPLGEHIEAGPAGGSGNFFLQTLASAVAGNVSTTTTLAAANALRRYHSLAIYYNASGDAASRTLTGTLRRPYGALPTGFATAANSDVWISPTLTLTANEEGTIYVGQGSMYYSGNDTGTITIANNASQPHPLPIWVHEDDPASLIIAIGSGNANDLYSAYALVEEWIVI